MTDTFRTCTGRLTSAGVTLDKWHLLDRLTDAADAFDLNHRTLSVLKALLSFFPERALPVSAGAAIVFPSNATLSHRLAGMPESTLRRHLATLVDRGLIQRFDSPNRKRFARRGGLSFGFDLAPLAQAAQTLEHAAQVASARAHECAVLRDKLAVFRMHAIEAGALDSTNPLLEDSRKVLRRKPCLEMLTEMIDRLTTLLEQSDQKDPVMINLSSGAVENERHIHSTEDNIIVDLPTVRTEPEPYEIAPTDIVENCQEYKTYFPETKPTWSELGDTSCKLSSMMGISRDLYESARRQLGPSGTIVTILCMLEKLSKIKKPGAYLRGLLRRAELNAFQPITMLRSVKHANIVS